jgi:hypothetical protein
MLSGMLTAIKAFVEDAFRRKYKSTGIEYDSANPFTELHTYYIATAVSGTFTGENELERFRLMK